VAKEEGRQRLHRLGLGKHKEGYQHTHTASAVDVDANVEEEPLVMSEGVGVQEGGAASGAYAGNGDAYGSAAATVKARIKQVLDSAATDLEGAGVTLSLDAKWYGNVGRFLNHSCKPNCCKQVKLAAGTLSRRHRCYSSVALFCGANSLKGA
jgi:hypothetical protein